MTLRDSFSDLGKKSLDNRKFLQNLAFHEFQKSDVTFSIFSVCHFCLQLFLQQSFSRFDYLWNRNSRLEPELLELRLLGDALFVVGKFFMEDFQHDFGGGGGHEEVKVIVARQRLNTFGLKIVKIN